MSERLSKVATIAVGERWGDDLSEERKQELRGHREKQAAWLALSNDKRDLGESSIEFGIS